MIVFTQLGRGNEKLMLALFMVVFGEGTAQIVKVGPFLEAFLFLIALPILIAILTQMWVNGD